MKKKKKKKYKPNIWLYLDLLEQVFLSILKAKTLHLHSWIYFIYNATVAVCKRSIT